MIQSQILLFSTILQATQMHILSPYSPGASTLQYSTPRQWVVHIIIAQFCSPETANHAIREGVVIVGKRAWARWLQKEPRRCLKCQSLTTNHLAASFICSTYGGVHHDHQQPILVHKLSDDRACLLGQAMPDLHGCLKTAQECRS